MTVDATPHTFRTRDGKSVEVTSVGTHGKTRKRSRRAIFLTWLRKIHLYVGLWGAVLGLLFGATGLILNHRAILKIPVEKTVVTSVQLTLPHSFANPEAMSSWLQQGNCTSLLSRQRSLSRNQLKPLYGQRVK